MKNKTIINNEHVFNKVKKFKSDTPYLVKYLINLIDKRLRFSSLFEAGLLC
jgi:hypothetical protein